MAVHCEKCHGLFVPGPNDVNLCSQCGHVSRQRMDTKTCPSCGIVFRVPIAYNRVVTCSTLCRSNWFSRDLKERFWEKVNKNESCWEWTAATTSFGYGCINIKGSVYTAHRLSYQWANGEVPKGMEVCHKCDNPRCVNPDHLFLGTHKENMHDRDRKGRLWTEKREATHAVGEQQGMAKLTDDAVREIRGLRGKVTHRTLAAKYGVSKTTIAYVMNGKIWKHVI